MPYKRMDGRTGYEFNYRQHSRFYSVDLLPGDAIVLYGGEIYINRKDREA